MEELADSVVDELRAELVNLPFDEVVRLLAEANTRASEAEQFLNYAPKEEVALHRRRVTLAQQSRMFDGTRPAIPMPFIRHGRSVWEAPEGLLSGSEVLRLPVGSWVRWVSDRRDSGLRHRASDGWRPMISETDFYWLEFTPEVRS
jgi:hypothetical protein